MVVSVVEAGADFHSRGSCVCVCVRLCMCAFVPCVSVCVPALVYVCVFVHGNVVGDSADRCVMTAYHCRCARVRVAGGPFWHVFSPRLHLCLWHSELGLTKEKQGGEVGGGVLGAGCRRLGGASRGENVLVAQSHGVTSSHGSGTGSRIHRLCGAKSHHGNQLLFKLFKLYVYILLQ